MLYRVARFICRAFMRVVYRARVEGLENVPASGPVIIASNHISSLDAILVAVFLRRRVHFMAKDELFRNRPMAFLFRHLSAFPVRRGRADRQAVRTALRLLGEGRVLGLFPEGTRSRDGRLRAPEPGVAMLALRGGCPVVPVVIHGPYRSFRPIRAEYCPAVDLSQYRDQRASSELLWRVSAEILRPVAERLGQPVPAREGTA